MGLFRGLFVGFITLPWLSKKFFMSDIFLLITTLDFLEVEGESPGDEAWEDVIVCAGGAEVWD